MSKFDVDIQTEPMQRLQNHFCNMNIFRTTQALMKQKLSFLFSNSHNISILRKKGIFIVFFCNHFKITFKIRRILLKSRNLSFCTYTLKMSLY